MKARGGYVSPGSGRLERLLEAGSCKSHRLAPRGCSHHFSAGTAVEYHSARVTPNLLRRARRTRGPQRFSKRKSLAGEAAGAEDHTPGHHRNPIRVTPVADQGCVRIRHTQVK